MSKKCELTGKSPLKGHKVSHANNKSKRKFLPNLKKVKLQHSGTLYLQTYHSHLTLHSQMRNMSYNLIKSLIKNFMIIAERKRWEHRKQIKEILLGSFIINIWPMTFSKVDWNIKYGFYHDTFFLKFIKFNKHIVIT